jgi:outer membrane lipoprotein carrier protein
MKLVIRVILLSLLAFSTAFAAEPSAADIAARVDRFYNNLNSLKADFVQSYRGGGMQRTESGIIWLKHPGKMRWEYRQPSTKYFVSDGHTAWFYAPGDQQARKAPLKKLDDLRTPLRYLLGKTKLNKEFDGLSLAPDVKPAAPDDVVLRGVPKGMTDRISQVLLEINQNNEIVRLVIEEVDGAVTEFRFSNLQPNAAAADTLFRSPVPAGVPVIATADVEP